MPLSCSETPACADAAQQPIIAVSSYDAVSSVSGVESAGTFWGHLGLRFVGKAKSKWYPLSSEEADRVRSNLYRSQDVSEWLVVETLNNHTLAFRPKQMQRIWLLDDACDAPEGDFEREAAWYNWEGLPAEVYLAMADWADGNSSGEGGPKSAYSEAIRESAVSLINLAGLTSRPDEVRSALRHTTIHFTDGSATQYGVNPENLLALAELEDDPDIQVVEISASGNDFESFYPARALTMIDIPTIELDAVRLKMWGG